MALSLKTENSLKLTGDRYVCALIGKYLERRDEALFEARLTRNAQFFRLHVSRARFAHHCYLKHIGGLGT